MKFLKLNTLIFCTLVFLPYSLLMAYEEPNYKVVQKNEIYEIRKYSNQNSVIKLIPYLKNDKKNNDNKINFILLKKIGTTALYDKSKISIRNLKNISKTISQY